MPTQSSPRLAAGRVLLIDMDGTLVDSEQDLALAVNYTLESLGHAPRSLEEVRSFVGNGAAVLLQKSLESSDPERLEEARNVFFSYYDAHLLDHTRLYAGWEAVFESGVPLVCATNKPERFARKILDGLGLSARFSMLVGGDTLPIKKPDAGVARHITAALGCELHDCVMIGDGIPDGALAQACGIPFWGARWGYAAEHELAPFAPAWLSSPAEILLRLQAS